MVFDTSYNSSSHPQDEFNAFAFEQPEDSSEDTMTLTSQKELDALRQQSSRLEHLLQVMPAGVIVIDGKGFVRQANEQAKLLLGEPLEEQLWRNIIARSFKPRADDGHEVSLVDGRRVKLSITPLEKEPGQLIVLTDLTETRQLQARVSHMQRLSSLGKMVASLAHQVRTPLSAAMLYAANLTRKGLNQEASLQFAHKLTDRLKELESQVNDMLLFAKSGEDQVVSSIHTEDIYQAVVQSAISLGQQHSVEIQFSGFDKSVQIIGNISSLQGAILNLIHNAMQVSPTGSKINVTAHVIKGQLCISVADSGPGVATDIQQKIFEPFFTTKTNGTGLGLAVVKSVASAHKGQLTVINAPKGGAIFTLALPCTSLTDIQRDEAQQIGVS